MRTNGYSVRCVVERCVVEIRVLTVGGAARDGRAHTHDRDNHTWSRSSAGGWIGVEAAPHGRAQERPAAAETETGRSCAEGSEGQRDLSEHLTGLQACVSLTGIGHGEGLDGGGLDTAVGVERPGDLTNPLDRKSVV